MYKPEFYIQFITNLSLNQICIYYRVPVLLIVSCWSYEKWGKHSGCAALTQNHKPILNTTCLYCQGICSSVSLLCMFRVSVKPAIYKWKLNGNWLATLPKFKRQSKSAMETSLWHLRIGRHRNHYKTHQNKVLLYNRTKRRERRCVWLYTKAPQIKSLKL